MNKYLLATVLIMCFLASQVLAQVDPTALMKTVTPITPEMTSIARYTIAPPNLYNGLPQQNIALYTLQEKDISYSISLYYNYSGFRIREEATNIGLGWGMSEGTIVRIVKHVPDEYPGLMMKFQDFGETMIEDWQIVPPPLYADYDPAMEYTPFSITANRLALKIYDAQPDLYIYNFNGYNGRFLWINDAPVQLDQNDLKIERDINNVFYITTPDGIKYSFGKTDFSTINTDNVSAATCGGSPLQTYNNPGHISGWHLTQIKSNVTQAQIDFSYESIGISEMEPSNEVNTLTLSGDQGPSFPLHYTNVSVNGISGTAGKSSWVLHQILSDNYKITVTLTNRLDNDATKIDNIKVYSNQNLFQPVKTITFDHGYFGDASAKSSCYLRLNGIQLDGGGQNDKYVFSYVYASANIGDKHSLSIDHWGYFNGRGNSTLIPLTSELQADLTRCSLNAGITFADRSPSFDHALHYAMEKVQFPTGGYAKYNYESAGGRGIRVVSMEANDNQNSIYKYYTYYNSYSGTSDVPAPLYPSSYYLLKSDPYWAGSSTPIAKDIKIFTAFVSPSLDVYGENSNFYDSVTESIGTPTSGGGKTVYKFRQFTSDKILLVGKSYYKAGSASAIKTEQYNYNPVVLKLINFWGIPELLVSPVSGPSESVHGVSCFPDDPQFGYMLGSYSLTPSFTTAFWFQLESTSVTEDGLNYVTNYFYKDRDIVTNLPGHINPVRTEETLSDGTLKTSNFYYSGDIDPDNTGTTLGITQMFGKHLIAPLKTRIYKQSALTFKDVSTYVYDPGNDLLLLTTYEKYPTGGPAVKKMNMLYNSKANLISINEENGINNSYIWDKNQIYPIAHVANAQVNDIFHSSFEDTEGNSSDGDSKTGKKSRTGGYTKLLSNLTNGNYTLTWWQKSGNSWSLQTSSVSVSNTTYTINLTGQVDEVRFYPVVAQMTTFTYEPLIGMTSQCDARNTITYYEYDSFGRLKHIRDQDKNILKSFDYKYQQQQ